MLAEVLGSEEDWVDVLVLCHLPFLHRADLGQTDDSLYAGILLLCLGGALGFLFDADKVTLAIFAITFFFVSAVHMLLSDSFPVSEDDHTDGVSVSTSGLVDAEPRRRCIVFGASGALAEVERREDVGVVGEGDRAGFGLHLGDLRRLGEDRLQGRGVLGVGWVRGRRQWRFWVDVACW